MHEHTNGQTDKGTGGLFELLSQLKSIDKFYDLLGKADLEKGIMGSVGTNGKLTCSCPRVFHDTH